MDLNLTEFQKLKPNVTGFQLVNWSNPTMEKINQDWLDFDNKDLKLARRRLRVRTPACPGPSKVPGVLHGNQDGIAFCFFVLFSTREL